jgi:hypothetical protein
MIEILDTIGWCLIAMGLCIYLCYFKEINKEFKIRFRWALQNTRQTYYEVFYPYGYYLMEKIPGTDIYYQSMAKQNYNRQILYNRKMMKR